MGMGYEGFDCTGNLELLRVVVSCVVKNRAET